MASKCVQRFKAYIHVSVQSVYLVSNKFIFVNVVSSVKTV